MDERHKPNHTSYSLLYHLVLVTARREPLITADMAAYLTSFFQAKCEELGVRLLEQAVLCDHVHLILSMCPTHYLPEVIGCLKGAASHEANHHREFANSLYWMRGYHIDTVSARTLDRARQYVRGQLRHHPDRVPQMPGCTLHGNSQ